MSGAERIFNAGNISTIDIIFLFNEAEREVFKRNPLLAGQGIDNNSIQAFKDANPYPLVQDASNLYQGGGVQWKLYKQYDYPVGDLADSRTTAQMETAISATGIPGWRYKLHSHPTEGMDSVSAGFHSMIVAASNSGGFGAIIPANAAGRSGTSPFIQNEAFDPNRDGTDLVSRYPVEKDAAINGSVKDNVGQDYVLLLLPNGAIIHGYLDETALAFYKKGIQSGAVKAWHAAAPNNGSKFRSLDYEPYFTAALLDYLEQATKRHSKEELVELLKNGYAERLLEALASKDVGINLLGNKVDPEKLPDVAARFVAETDNFGNGTLAVTYEEVREYGIDPDKTPLVFATQGKDDKWRSLVTDVGQNGESFKTPFSKLAATRSSKPNDLLAKVWGLTNSNVRFVAAFLRKKKFSDVSFASYFNAQPGSEFAACPVETLNELKEVAHKHNRAIYLDDAGLLGRLTRVGLVNGFDSRKLSEKLAKNDFTVGELKTLFPATYYRPTNVARSIGTNVSRRTRSIGTNLRHRTHRALVSAANYCAPRQG